MEVKIVFYKSSSKYYDQVCLKCEKFEKFIYQDNCNILKLNIEEIINNSNELHSIIEIIKNWTKTRFYIDEKNISLYQLQDFFSVIKCADNYNEDEYCYAEEGWGCKYISSIFLRKEKYNNYYYSGKSWFEYGYFNNEIWIVDKDKIKNKIYCEIEEKNLKVCKYFDINKIDKSIDLLPDKIEIKDDENCKWEYKYRESPIGLEQTEIIGIKPKKKEENEFRNIFSVKGLLDNRTKDIERNKVIKKNVPNITFNDIGGIDEIVQQVREVIELPLTIPKIFEHYAIKPHKGILLYGPPGCGKTLIAKAIANETDAHFIVVNGPEIINKFMGQSEENIRKVFDEAKENAPSIIYFDEFDSISSTRDNEQNPHMASVVNQLLTLMDGVNSDDKICVIASTNRVDIIDEALKRPGRFDYVIEVKKPSPEGCKKIFRIHTRNMPIENSFDKDIFVENNLLGLSGAEIAFIPIEAAYNSIRRTIDTKKMLNSKEKDYELSDKNIIIEEDFIKAVETLKKH